MKASTILIVTFASLAMIMAAEASDDSKCRDFAKANNMNEAQLSGVGPFRLYGPPKAGQSCDSVCSQKDKDVALEYVGNQACCCASRLSNHFVKLV